MRKILRVVLILLVAAGVILWVKESSRVRGSGLPLVGSNQLKLIPEPKTAADRIVNGAKKQVMKMVKYDSSYVKLTYPYGDVPANSGACTDVIIRALRCAGYDLQKLIHEDMQHNFRLYPRKWGTEAPDPNIDHRRVPNHIVFMRRFAEELPVGTSGSDLKTWKPGDLVYWDLNGSGMTHCGVISDVTGPRGLPMVLHNIGPWATQDDVLDSWKVLGHYRYPSANRTIRPSGEQHRAPRRGAPGGLSRPDTSCPMT